MTRKKRFFTGITLKGLALESNEYEPDVQIHFVYPDDCDEHAYILVTELSLPDFISIKLLIIDEQPRFAISMFGSDMGYIITDSFFWNGSTLRFQSNFGSDDTAKFTEIINNQCTFDSLGTAYVDVLRKLNSDIENKKIPLT